MSISPEIQGFVRSEIQSVLLDKEKLTYRVHNLEHLLQDFIDFVEKPQIAGDGFAALAAYSEALCKHARIALEG